MVEAHTFNLSTQKAEVVGSEFQASLVQSEFQDSHGCYTEKVCLEPHTQFPKKGKPGNQL